MDPTFRFLHASDLHLERVPGGLADVPDHLRASLIDAPYRAAERIFEAAFKHRVDFIVLSGDVIDPAAAGPRGVVFLNEQFARLREAGIVVYWAGSPLEHFGRWAELWPLPDGVHRFPTDHVESIVHYRAGEPLVQIQGMSCRADSRPDWDGYHADPELFTVAVGYGQVEADRLARRSVSYWALGGEHTRRTLLGGTVTAHYSGTPQGRQLSEAGPHGCTLVHVDETRRVRTTFLPTDAVRYYDERITLADDATSEALVAAIHERAAELLLDPFGPDLLITWHVSAGEALTRELAAGKAAELLAGLRTEFGSRHPAAWSVALESPPPAIPAKRYDEETLLGEFLRTARHYTDHPDEPLVLEEFLAERYLAGTLGALARLDNQGSRSRILHEAAALGVELLSPAEDRK
jgi:exonuclease SbcD